jgi:hypothetical protein
LSLSTSDTSFLEAVGKLLPSQKTGLLAAGLTTESAIDALTAHIDAAVTSPLHRSTTVIIVDAIGQVPG